MQKSLLILILVTALAVVAARLTLSGDDRGEAGVELGPLLPELAEREADLAALEIVSGGETLRLERRDERWVSADLNGYPAKLEQVAKLVRGLVDLEKIEPKTQRPELHDRLGLADPGAEGSSAVLVRALDTNDETLTAVVLGNRYYEMPGENRYARLPDADQTWLVAGNPPTTASPMSWVDAVALNLGSDAIARVAGFEDGAEAFAVVREKGSFSWEPEGGVPEGFELAGGGLPGRMGRLLANLRFDQVLPLDGVELPESPAHQIEATTFDGLIVRARAYEPVDVDPEAAEDPEAAQNNEQLWLTLELSLPDPLPEDPTAVQEQFEQHAKGQEDWLYRIDTFSAGGMRIRGDQFFIEIETEEDLEATGEVVGPELEPTDG